MIRYNILKSIHLVVIGATLVMGTSLMLWGQQPNVVNKARKSAYSSKVFSEIDHLTRIMRVNLTKHLKTLQKAETARFKKQENVENLTRVQRTRFQLIEQGNDVLAGDEKDVATLLPELQQLVGDKELLEETEVEVIDPALRALFREEVSLISVNVYTEKNKEEINKYLSAKLESTYFKKFPRFSFYKDERFFQYHYEELNDSYVFSYGPQKNAEVTETLQKRGGKYYARVYFFRLSDRSIIDLNIYDSATHELVWGKRQSMYVSFKETSLAYRFLVGLSAEENAGFSITNFVGIRLPVIGIYGIFFTFGAIAVDPAGSQFYFRYTAVSAILITVAVGPQISYSLNELFGFSYLCCEFFVDFQFGYKNNVAINASPDFLAREGSIQQNFATFIGFSMSVRKFIVYFNYDPLNNAWGAGGGFNF